MSADPFDFDNPDLGLDEELPEFSEEEEGGDVLDDIVDEDDDVLLSGMDKTEILAALEQEFGVIEDEDISRSELAEQLIALREDALLEDEEPNGQEEENDVVSPELGEDPAQDVSTVPTEDEGEDVEEDVEVDWVDDEEDGSFVGEEDGDEILPNDEEDEEELTQSLKSALKTQGLEAKHYDTEEAVTKMRGFDDDVTKHKEKVMLLRWKQGLVAQATPVVHGESTMSALSEATGVHENTLRNAKRLVKEFNFNVSEFRDWIREADDGIRPWYHVRDLLKDEEPQEDDSEEEQERKRDKLKKKVETLAHELEKVNGMLREADEEERREVEGLTQQAMSEIQEFMNSRFYEQAEMDGNDPIPRSREYLDWIKNFPDPINRKPSHDPCHTGGRKGTGIKSSDFSAIPLTRTHHNELDEKGQDWFESQYDVSVDRLVKEYQHRFLTGQWLDMELPTPEDL